jgi:hypothetical protein
MLTIFEVMACSRIIVHASESTGAIYTWNQSATLQAWGAVTQDRARDRWEEYYIRTINDLTLDKAIAAAKEWDQEMIGE